jgi:hypothetical protein
MYKNMMKLREDYIVEIFYIKIPLQKYCPRQEKHPSPPPVIIIRRDIKGKRARALRRCSRFIIFLRVSLILSLCKLFVPLIKKIPSYSRAQKPFLRIFSQ